MEIETDFTDEIICPFCGYIFSDSWEYNHTDDMADCPECGKRFELEIDESVTYTTQKPDWLQQWRRYNESRTSECIWKREREANTVPVVFK